jgi:hypothetical protein
MRRFVVVDETWAQLALSTIRAARAHGAARARALTVWLTADASVVVSALDSFERAPWPPARACALFALSIAIACVSEVVLRARVARAQRSCGAHGA